MDYAHYLQCAFAPELYPLFALNCELIHVHHSVSEEMLGHIRYAWWAETVAAFDKKHPVIEALAASGIPQDKLLALVNTYREAYPEMPANVEPLLDDAISLSDKTRWNKAANIIKTHTGGRLTLLAKLLFC